MNTAYIVRPALVRPELKGWWEGPAWKGVDVITVACFRPEGSDHRPATSVKMLYDDSGIYGIFGVEDRYVRCVRTRYGEPVYKDSCVEFFVQPASGAGYFNFEFNCGGTMLACYITNPERTAGGFREFVSLPETEASGVAVFHSLPRVIDPEIEGPTLWYLEYFIPRGLLERYSGRFGEFRGGQWRANFFKCGDETSHPHWASWQPVPELNFHLPGRFGTIRFGE